MHTAGGHMNFIHTEQLCLRLLFTRTGTALYSYSDVLPLITHHILFSVDKLQSKIVCFLESQMLEHFI